MSYAIAQDIGPSFSKVFKNRNKLYDDYSELG